MGASQITSRASASASCRIEGAAGDHPGRSLQARIQQQDAAVGLGTRHTLLLPMAATPDSAGLSIRQFMALLLYKVIHSATASQDREMGFLERSVVDYG
jgi:hypothetical protein